MNRRVWLSVLLTVLVIGVVAAIGYGVYQIGFDQGVATTAGETTTVIQTGHRGYGWGFFPWFIFPLFFFFLFFIGKAFWWGPWRGGWRGPYGGGPYDGGPYGGSEGEVPPHIERRLQTWHEQAHAEKKE